MTEVREETVIFYLMAENGDLEECIMAFDRNIESKDMGAVAACIM